MSRQVPPHDVSYGAPLSVLTKQSMWFVKYGSCTVPANGMNQMPGTRPRFLIFSAVVFMPLGYGPVGLCFVKSFFGLLGLVRLKPACQPSSICTREKPNGASSFEVKVANSARCASSAAPPCGCEYHVQ